MAGKIASIDSHSPAERAKLRVGDTLLSINGKEIADVLDYRFYAYDPKLTLVVESPDGKQRTVHIRKAEGEDIGLNFETYLMDEERCCSNHCLFCFVDQMPPNMRDTLYFKDDDARLSFLMGNYTTLTNLSEREAQRIIDLRISPINVSVHATDPKLRSIMLGNKAAAKGLAYMRAFADAGIVMNCQIVVCPGLNDGEQLSRSMEDLADMGVASCAIVPVGVTKYRKGLYKMPVVDRTIANEILNRVLPFSERCLERFGTRLFFCSDEIFIKAGRPLPDDASYPPVLQKLNLLMRVRLFRPKVIVEYDRTPFVEKLGNTRITLDRNIRSSDAVSLFLEKKIPARPIMPAGKQILEVKYDEYLPDYLYRNLMLSHLRQTAFSKYYLCRKYSLTGALK